MVVSDVAHMKFGAGSNLTGGIGACPFLIRVPSFSLMVMVISFALTSANPS